MSVQQIEKLKKLIAESSILNSYEKQEWLQLLELMNDKQLLELERILAPAESPKPAPQPRASPQIKASPVPVIISAPQKQPEKPGPKMPLGHIINLPKVEKTAAPEKPAPKPSFGISSLSPVFAKAAGKSGQKNAGSPAAPSAGGFSAKLKNMLAEPELPPGLLEHELELPAPEKETHIFQLKPKAPPPVPVPPPKIIPQAGQLVEEKSPRTEAGTAQNTKLKELFEPAQQKVDQVLTRTGKLERYQKSEEGKGLEKWPKFYDVTGKTASKPGQAPSSVLQRGAPAASPAPLKPLDLKQPADLQNLGADALRSDLEKPLRGFIKRYGYHKVIPFLEKSPLYQSYINTGREILEKSSSFESAYKGNRKLLDRGSFERMADLLRVIQAG